MYTRTIYGCIPACCFFCVQMLEQQHGSVLAVGYVCASKQKSSPEPMEVEQPSTEDEQRSKKLKRDNVLVDVIVRLG